MAAGWIAPAAAQSFYHVYVDVGGLVCAPPVVERQVSLVDDVADEGQSSYEISTLRGTYYYQKDAGGFSSLLDSDGNDWIGYHQSGGSAGE